MIHDHGELGSGVSMDYLPYLPSDNSSLDDHSVSGHHPLDHDSRGLNHLYLRPGRLLRDRNDPLRQ